MIEHNCIFVTLLWSVWFLFYILVIHYVYNSTLEQLWIQWYLVVSFFSIGASAQLKYAVNLLMKTDEGVSWKF